MGKIKQIAFALALLLAFYAVTAAYFGFWPFGFLHQSEYDNPEKQNNIQWMLSPQDWRGVETFFAVEAKANDTVLSIAPELDTLYGRVQVRPVGNSKENNSVVFFRTGNFSVLDRLHPRFVMVFISQPIDPANNCTLAIDGVNVSTSRKTGYWANGTFTFDCRKNAPMLDYLYRYDRLTLNENNVTHYSLWRLYKSKDNSLRIFEVLNGTPWEQPQQDNRSRLNLT